jgi:hypothetical protein
LNAEGRRRQLLECPDYSLLAFDIVGEGRRRGGVRTLALTGDKDQQWFSARGVGTLSGACIKMVFRKQGFRKKTRRGCKCRAKGGSQNE